MLADPCFARGAVLDLARVLVVHSDPASRITLQTVLEAGGYRVDTANDTEAALTMMSEQPYELVLSSTNLEKRDVGRQLIEMARHMEYEPATALVRTWRTDSPAEGAAPSASLLIKAEDIPGLLTRVANLISSRATRRIARELEFATADL